LANDRYVDYVKDIHHSGSHLLAIINDILDLAKAESGKLQLSEDEFLLSDLLAQCERICGHLAESNNVKLDFICREKGLCVFADKRLLLQILVNLISNATKFALQGAVRVEVSANYRDGLMMSVSDNGIGIAPENIERVMKPFEQVEASYTRVRSGCGLGLPYAKSLTELHGGTLTIESELGHGTTVYVNLPAGRIVGNINADPLENVA
jgi:signal transduction histidine kinase